MKKLVLFLSISGIGFNLSAQKWQDKFVLNGTLSGKEEVSLYLRYIDKENKHVLDSSLIRNGNFSFKGDIIEPTMAEIIVKERKTNQSNSLDIWLDPVVMKMEINLNEFEKVNISGSTTHDEYVALKNARALVKTKYKIQLDSLLGLKDKEKIAAIRERLEPYFLEMDHAELDFFDKHRLSYVTVYWMRYHVGTVSLDSLKMFYAQMGEQLQASSSGKYFADQIEQLSNGSPGSKAKNFTSIDINGKKLSLSDYNGKYVLLDFWASWCVPCRKGNPYLIKLYNKYRGKGIEFVGISDDDGNPDAWKKAVDKDGLPWRHVLKGSNIEKQLKVINNESDISKLFGIYVLPTKILIDANGMIVGRFGEQEDDELNAMLNKIFGE